MPPSLRPCASRLRFGTLDARRRLWRSLDPCVTRASSPTTSPGGGGTVPLDIQQQLRQLVGHDAAEHLVHEAETTYGPGGTNEAAAAVSYIEEADLDEEQLDQYERAARRVRDKDGKQVWDVLAESEREKYEQNVRHVAETEEAKNDLVALFAALNGRAAGMSATEAAERVLDALRREGRLTETLVAVCQDRVELAREQEEDEEVLESLENVLLRLKYELQRDQATPALRLLDDVMRVLAENERVGRHGAASVEPAALNYVRSELARAFGSADVLTSSGHDYETDALTYAVTLGYGGGATNGAAHDAADSFLLTREEFVAECETLLRDVGMRDLEAHREAEELEELSPYSSRASSGSRISDADWAERKAAVDRVRLVMDLARSL